VGGDKCSRHSPPLRRKTSPSEALALYRHRDPFMLVFLMQGAVLFLGGVVMSRTPTTAAG
jgi:hypothetical protein